MVVLTRVRLRGLFNLWDHIINFPEDSDLVIIYGPNGVGKTKLLEAVDALVSLKFSKLHNISFEELDLSFSDSSKLSAVPLIEEKTSAASSKTPIRITLKRESKVLDSFVSYGTPDEVTEFLANSNLWVQVDDDLWEDRSDGELATTSELSRRYSIPGSGRSRRDKQEPAIPEVVQEFMQQINARLIATQRLLNFADDPVARYGRSHPRRPTVREYSEDIKRRLANALAQNSRTTQQLDRTFPKRILDSDTPSISDTEIREWYEKQNDLRKRLATIAVVGAEADLPLPQRTLQDWERTVLWTSLKDTDQKLASFEFVLDRITLLEEILNSRFLGKKISVTAENGLNIYREDDHSPLDLGSLSSGEQHELVLVYDLLFNAQKNTTVLIDEPEISLHVAWQRNFLTDILRIAALSSLRFVVATHSPQIINKWWDYTVPLGPDPDAR